MRKRGIHRIRDRMRLERPCGGTFRNGPDKAFVRCDRCSAIDHEKNEGDRCARPPNEPIACWSPGCYLAVDRVGYCTVHGKPPTRSEA